MKRFIYIFCFFTLSATIIACNTHANAPSSSDNQGDMELIPLEDEPRKFGTINLNYVDTNSVEWRKIIYKLDSFYNNQVKLYGFSGGVLVGSNGQVLYERYFGYANKELGLTWDSKTPSQLASTSKTMTATAVLYLHEKRYLNIDEPVKSYIDGFPYPDVTVRMLLNHRSGIPSYENWYNKFVPNGTKEIYNDDVVALMIKHKPAQQFKTNTAFKYSNSNYMLLATIIERVTEMKFKDFMKKYIFEPLQMNNTFVYDPADGLPGNAAKSYRANWSIWANNFADGVYGDKGIYSTTKDMYKWDQSFYKKYLLDNETIELAYGPCSFEKPGIKNYGLGWRMLCYPDGYKVIFHNGWWHGNNTCFFRFIKDNFTIVVLGNKYSQKIYQQPTAIYGIVKGIDSLTSFEDVE